MENFEVFYILQLSEVLTLQINSYWILVTHFSFNFPHRKTNILFLTEFLFFSVGLEMKNKPNLDLYPFNKKVSLDLLCE